MKKQSKFIGTWEVLGINETEKKVIWFSSDNHLFVQELKEFLGESWEFKYVVNLGSVLEYLTDLADQPDQSGNKYLLKKLLNWVKRFF